jgi:hypothetical protein
MQTISHPHYYIQIFTNIEDIQILNRTRILKFSLLFVADHRWQRRTRYIHIWSSHFLRLVFLKPFELDPMHSQQHSLVKQQDAACCVPSDSSVTAGSDEGHEHEWAEHGPFQGLQAHADGPSSKGPRQAPPRPRSTANAAGALPSLVPRATLTPNFFPEVILN